VVDIYQFLTSDISPAIGFANQAIAIGFKPNRPNLPGFFAMTVAQSVNAIVQTGALDRVLVIDKFASTEHSPAALLI